MCHDRLRRTLEGRKVSWYVIREIPKPPYEVTVSCHPTEGDAYAACPDDPDFSVWPRPAEPWEVVDS
jgi:hypothetical protein